MWSREELGVTYGTGIYYLFTFFVDFFQLAEQAEKEKEAEDDEEEEEDEEEEDEEKAEAGKPKSGQGRGKHIRDRLKFFFCIKIMGPKKRIGKSR